MTQDIEVAFDRLVMGLVGTDIQPITCLRHKSDATVFLANWNGQPVILKQFHSDGSARLSRMQAELETVSALMEDTPHRINRFLGGLPDLGVAILEYAGEIRLSQAIAEAGVRRGAMMGQAADWLAAYVGPRRRTEAFRSRRWLDKTFGVNLPLTDVQSRAAPLLQKMGRRLAGAPFTRAATHGDFVSINAMWQGGQIIGIDVQGEAWLPLARDMARFMVWQEMSDPSPGPWLWGLSCQDLQPFLDATLISQEEADTILRFFIGLQLVQCLFDLRRKPKAVAAGEAALSRWCEQK